MKLANLTSTSLGGAMPVLIPTVGGPARAESDPELAELAERAAAANEHLMRGDIAFYRQVLQLTDDFTLMDPFGGKPTGRPASEEHWNRIGRFFREGRDASFELITSYRSNDLAVLIANEHAHVAVGSLSAQQWSLRVTLVFRKDEDAWRLVHRHADPLTPGLTLEQAAALASGEGK
jgi:ketosteroid isomerase-like protein